MTRYDSTKLKETSHPTETSTPLLDNLVSNVINSLDIRLRPLATRALGTRFHPDSGEPKSALAVNSFREQWQLLERLNPDIAQRFREWGIGSLIDSVKQQDVNLATNRNTGDSYILNNLESALSFAKHKDYDVMLGRYSGDELIAFFIPKDGPVDPEVLNKEFIEYNQKFLESNTSLSKVLEGVLPILIAAHGNELKLGATIKSKSVTNLRFNNKANMRDRQLLSSLIDHVEDKFDTIPDTTQSSLCDSLIHSWQSPRAIKDLEAINLETSWFSSILPSSVLDLYLEAVQKGIPPSIAATYSEEATFESIYPRMRVYRLEVFPEVARKFAKDYGSVALFKSADPYIKWTNKFVSHYAGDHRMIGLAENYHIIYDASAQHHGSFIHILQSRLVEQYLITDKRVTDDQHDAKLNPQNHKPTPFKVTTNFINPGKDQKILYINPETTDEEIWDYIEDLSNQQTENEILTLVERSGYGYTALKNLIRYLSVRINRLEEFKSIAQEEEYDPALVARVTRAAERLASRPPSH